MKIIDKIKFCQDNLYTSKTPVIAFIGDSVTQGCFECISEGESGLQTVYDEKSAYVRRTQEILSVLYPSVKINFINAGLNGADLQIGLDNLEENVLAYKPDLTVVSFGLNDAVKGENGIDEYAKKLGKMLDKIIENGSEAIFLTQNFMCEHTSFCLKDKIFINLSKQFCALQNEGVLDKYFEIAKKECDKRSVKICDVRKMWQKMSHAGVNITELLANKLNHPIREIHYYMAIKIVETIIE